MTAGRPVPRAYRPPPPRRDVAPVRKTGWRAVAAIVFIFDLGLATWLWVTDPAQWPVGAAIAVMPLLLLATMPLFVWAARTETRFDLAGLLATGLLLRFAGSFFRFQNAADATVYHGIGSTLAASFRHFDFAGDVRGRVPGTGGMNFIAGLAEVVTNANEFATFLLFAWLAFIGCFLLYRAFVIALPTADHRRYALLIFLWPTMLFWPSSLGKDSWMIFTLGIGAIGAARVLVRRPGGYTLLAVGTLLGSVVRPHVVLLELVAFALAFLIGRQPDRGGAITPSSVGKVAGLVVLLILGAVLVQRFGTLVGSSDLTDVDSVLAINANAHRSRRFGVLARRSHRSGRLRRSCCHRVVPPVPQRNRWARTDGRGCRSLCAPGALHHRRGGVSSTIPRRLRTEPYVTLALTYVLMFIFGFGTIANFGILARQRSQLVPFAFVLLSVTAATASQGRSVRAKRQAVAGALSVESRRYPRATRGRPVSRPASSTSRAITS